MPNPSAALMLLAAATALDSSAPPLDGMRFAQVTIRERIIVRVPNMEPRDTPRARNQAPPSAPTARWVEKKGPKCIATAQLGGAIVGSKSVDLVFRGGDRVRAILDGDCPALDFYGGFYLHPSADGLVCADRDTIRSRSGDSCTISKFRQLVIKR